MKTMNLAAAAVFAALTLIACNHKIDNEMPAGPQPKEGTITVNVEGLGTKAVMNTDNEVKINDIQLLVFRSDNVLETYAKGTDKSIKVRCSGGKKTVYALVNTPSMEDVANLAALEEKTSLLKDNKLTGFQMAGHSAITVNGDANTNISVSRFVSRIVLEKVTNNFTAPAYQKAEFKVEKVFLLNVAGDYSLKDESTFASGKASSAPKVWHNKLIWDNELPELTADLNIAQTVTYGKSWEGKKAYYAYPNPTDADNTGSAWSPRYTRLVIQTSLGGTTYYYPISIKNLERNKTYNLTNVTITRPGSTSPDEPITVSDCTFTLQVANWEAGLTKEETI